MKLEAVIERMTRHLAQRNSWAVMQQQSALRAVYDQVIATRARDCLELGTAWGTTTCVIAAALDELGGGTVTTVDIMNREPVGVAELAQATGLAAHVRPVVLKAGYNWFLLDVLRRQTSGRCEPCYDFCFLDGAHLWEPDAAAVMLVTKLLRPGAWLLLDDLHWKPRYHPGWEKNFADMSADEVNTAQVGMVYDLLVRTHPDLGHFVLSHGGHQGWARKAGDGPITWPQGVIAAPVTGSWEASCSGAEAVRAGGHNHHILVEEHAEFARIHSAVEDPNVILQVPGNAMQPIDYVTLRVRLVAPDMEFVQLFWVGGDDAFFDEARSTRCLIRSSRAAQDLTFPIIGLEHECRLRQLRLDPFDRAGEMLLERVTVGRW